nr:MAG TPA: chromosome segregation protein [Caudoviricetes sp.]
MDKLKNVRISMLDKSTGKSKPVNVVTSADSVLMDGDVTLKEYLANNMSGGGPIAGTGIGNVATKEIVEGLKDELSDLNEKINSLPEAITTNMNAEELVQLKKNVASMMTDVSKLNLKDNLSMTKDEANYLRGKMDEAISKLAKMQEQMDSLPVSKQDALEVDLAALKKTMNEFKVKMAGLTIQDKIAMTSEEANALRTKVDQALVDTGTLKEAIAKLPTEDLKNVKQNIDNIQNQLATLQLPEGGFAKKVDFDSLKNTVDTLKNKVDNLPTGGSTSSGGSSVSDTEIATIKSNISDLQSKVAAIKLQDNITISKDEANSLRTKVDNLLVKVNALETSGVGGGSSQPATGGTVAPAVNSEEINSIKSTLQELQTKVTALQQAANTTSEAAINDLKSKFENITREVALLKLPSTITMTKEEGTALRAKVDEAILATSKMKEKVEALPNELNNSNASEIGSLKNRMSTVETTIGNIPSNVSSELSTVKSSLEQVKTNIGLVEAKLPTSFAVTKDEVNFIRNRTEELLKTTAKLEAGAKILPDYPSIIKKDETIVGIKTALDEAVNKVNTVKESIEKTYPVKPIVIATEKKLISFRKTIPMVEKVTSSKPKEIILELPEFSEFMDINFSCCLDMTTFSQWDYRDFSIMIDDGVDDDPDVGVRNEKVFGYRIYSSGGEKYLSIYQGFKILSNVKKLRIKMQTNGTVGVYSSYNLTEQVFVVNGTGV